MKQVYAAVFLRPHIKQAMEAMQEFEILETHQSTPHNVLAGRPYKHCGGRSA